MQVVMIRSTYNYDSRYRYRFNHFDKIIVLQDHLFILRRIQRDKYKNYQLWCYKIVMFCREENIKKLLCE